MRYYANPSTPRVRDAMRAGLIDCIVTPNQGNKLPDGVRFCADNGAFGKGFPGDSAWYMWLQHLPPALCQFAVAPDVPFDALGTLDKSLPWLAKIRELGIPAALAFQDGIEDLLIPWDAFDVAFIAGSTEWKLGPAARAMAVEAKRRGKQVHMGRVNSGKRLRYAQYIGCDSADGTYVKWGPDVNLPKVLGWLRGTSAPQLYGDASWPETITHTEAKSKTTVCLVGGPWNGTAELDHVVGPVFAVGHPIGNHYWLDIKSDPPTYVWDGSEAGQ